MIVGAGPRSVAHCGLLPLVLASAWLGPGSTAHAASQPPPAGETAHGPLTVAHAWSRATAAGASVGVVYFEIQNAGPPDTLLSIDSPVAVRVEMHASTREDGMIKMRPVSSVDVPAGGRVAFQPGGLHAMLVGLRQPLQAGGSVPLTLVFRRAGRFHVEAEVQGLGTADPHAQGTREAPAGPSVRTAASARGDFRLASWPARTGSPSLRLLDFDGHRRRLADYRGRVLVIFFGFVRCPDACPAELLKLALAMKRLGPVSERVQVLFVTLDPERDLPQILKSYVTAFDPRFVGLTGSTADIDRAAESFYVEYARVGQGADYSIDHSTSSFVLDARGRLRLVGTLDATVDDWVHDLAAVAAE